MPNVTTKKVATKKSVAKELAPKATPKTVVKSKAAAKPTPKMAATANIIPADFVSNENVAYSYCLGRVVASSFSGFLAGIIVSSLIWIVVVNVFFMG